MVLTKEILKPYLDIRVYKEAKTLANNGFEVIVLCRVYSRSDLPQKEIYENFTIIRHKCSLSKNRYKFRFEQLIQNFKNVLSMSKKIIQLNPSIIHAHDLNALFESVLAKRKLDVPLIYDSHEDFPRWERAKGSNIAYFGALIYEKILLTNVDNIITVNETIAKKFKTNKPVTIIHNFPSYKDYVKNQKLIAEIKYKYNLQNKIVNEYHGVISYNRGFELILQVLEELSKVYDNVRLLLIGPFPEKLKKITKSKNLDEYLIFTGPIDYKEIASYISVSNISYAVIKPIEQYLISTPTKMFESMLMEKPVLANSEFPEVVKIMNTIESKKPGELVKYDKNAIISILKKLIDDEVLRKRYGKNARQLVIAKYTWNTQEKKLLDLYREIF